MTTKERDQKHELLRRTILKQLIVCGYSKKELAAMLNISLASLYNKLKAPDKFTLRELQVVYHKLEITKEELLKVI